MIKVGELIGYKALRALNGFSVLAIGLKMIPDYGHETFYDFFKRLQAMPPEEQERKIREALLVVEVQEPEVLALLSFCKDKNGVSYGPENLKNMKPAELIDSLVAVCMEIVKIRIDSITEDQKKKLKNSQ